MSEKKRIPEIRFNGFEGEWEKTDFGKELNNYSYGLNAAAKDYDGTNKYLRITDIDEDSREYSYYDLKSPDSSKQIIDKYLLTEGDILFARTGASVGKTHLYNKNDGKVCYAGFLIKANVKRNNDNNFIFNNTLTSNYYKFVKVTSQRSGQPGLNVEEIKSFEFYKAGNEEQTKIGKLLYCLDEQINQINNYINNLQSYKQSMLQKMFPIEGEKVPEIRFEGFEGEWEEKRLNKVCHIVKGTQLNKNDISKDGKFYHLNGGILPSNRTNLWNTDRNTISISEGGENCGFVNWNSQMFFSGGHNYTLKDLNLNSYYLYSFLKSIQGKIMRLRVGSGLPNIQIRDLEKVIIHIPSIQEQKIIGKFFRKLDNKTYLQQQKLSTYKKLKKTLLGKLFV